MAADRAGFLCLFLDCGSLEDKRGATVPEADMERQDGSDDCVLTAPGSLAVRVLCCTGSR